MPDAPQTRLSLLLRLRDPRDYEAWAQFVDVYAPLIYGYVRKRGLQDADAADLTQVCLRQVTLHVGSLEYDPQQGSFRGWLFTIVRNRLRNYRAQPRHLQGSGDSQIQHLLETLAAPEADEAGAWEREYRERMFAWASQQVRSTVEDATWQAFWQTAVEGKPGKDVAENLSLSLSAVYVAKSRVMARLRSLIHDAQEED